MSHHWVKDDDVVGEVRKELRKLYGWEDAGTVEVVAERMRGFLARQRTLPDLVGVTEAAVILSLPKPRISRLREQGRMPEPAAVLSSGPVFIREEVAELAVILQGEREERAARRAERDGAEA